MLAIEASMDALRPIEQDASAQGLIVLTNAAQPSASHVLPGAEEQEGDHGRQDPNLGAASDLSLRLPAKELARDFECHEQSDQERHGVGNDLAHGYEVGRGSFE